MSGTRRYMAANDAAAKANGSGKHWTKEERRLRELTEVKPKAEKKIMAPKWLTAPELRREFYEIARMLSKMDIGFCQTDADFLGWFLTARMEYNAASGHLRRAIQDGDDKLAASWASTRNKFFSEAKACANELGLTVSSRCKLVAPVQEQEADDPLARLLEKRRSGA